MSAKPVLVLNSGSSSIKFSLFRHNLTRIMTGLAERLGSDDARIKIDWNGNAFAQPIKNYDHNHALQWLVDYLRQQDIDLTTLGCIGHRVVHGGERFSASTLINDQVISEIRACSHLAPLHNPANLLGITAMSEFAPEVPQVAVFDTAFHQTLKPEAFLYALPYELYQKQGVRRYGFHGTSHRYVARQAAEILGRSADSLNLLTIHLGNGCSACAIKKGLSVDTTMGMTPLEGLVMGTRSGDIDPSLHQFLTERLGLSLDQVTQMLNRDSGLKGISGLTNDMRVLQEEAEKGNDRAQLAIDVFCFKLARALGGLAASLEHIDALVFTGGIGENSALVRQKVMHRLSILGLAADDDANRVHGRDHSGRVSTKDGLTALVIATDEELMIAEDCRQLTANY